MTEPRSVEERKEAVAFVWAEVGGLRQVVDRLEHERDEALAQVAVLWKSHDAHCSIPPPCSCAPANLPTKARALLTRLERAEWVGEAAKPFASAPVAGDTFLVEGRNINTLRDALTAWQEARNAP